MQWIDVKEQLPAVAVNVLLYSHTKIQYVIGYRSVKNPNSFVASFTCCTVHRVTHWLPLPEPPK